MTIKGFDELKNKKTPKTAKVVSKYWVKVPLQTPGATGIGKSNRFIEKGAERVTFELREVDRDNVIVGPDLVWKEDLTYNNNQLEWHVLFAHTQIQAQRLATKFNEQLNRVCVPDDIARLVFIEPSVYAFYRKDGSCMDGLCEEFLPHFTKWTDNCGGVKHEANTASRRARGGPEMGGGGGKADAETEEPALSATAALAALTLEDDDASVAPATSCGTAGGGGRLDTESSKATDGSATRLPSEPIGHRPKTASQAYKDLCERIIDEDVLLAFSHWSYVYTQRESLVCDLQGAKVTTKAGRPQFKLTDPCIHSKRRGTFGNTDHGRSGQNSFLRTHKCTPVCQLLGIDRKYKARK